MRPAPYRSPTSRPMDDLEGMAHPPAFLYVLFYLPYGLWHYAGRFVTSADHARQHPDVFT
jgi:hypothetical protein